MLRFCGSGIFRRLRGGCAFLQDILHEGYNAPLVGRKIKGVLAIPKTFAPGILEHGQPNIANLGIADPVHNAHKGKTVAGAGKGVARLALVVGQHH